MGRLPETPALIGEEEATHVDGIPTGDVDDLDGAQLQTALLVALMALSVMQSSPVGAHEPVSSQ